MTAQWGKIKARPVTHAESLKTELIYILKIIGSQVGNVPHISIHQMMLG